MCKMRFSKPFFDFAGTPAQHHAEHASQHRAQLGPARSEATKKLHGWPPNCSREMVPATLAFSLSYAAVALIYFHFPKMENSASTEKVYTRIFRIVQDRVSSRSPKFPQEQIKEFDPSVGLFRKANGSYNMKWWSMHLKIKCPEQGCPREHTSSVKQLLKRANADRPEEAALCAIHRTINHSRSPQEKTEYQGQRLGNRMTINKVFLNNRFEAAHVNVYCASPGCENRWVITGETALVEYRLCGSCGAAVAKS